MVSKDYFLFVTLKEPNIFYIVNFIFLMICKFLQRNTKIVMDSRQRRPGRKSDQSPASTPPPIGWNPPRRSHGTPAEGRHYPGLFTEEEQANRKGGSWPPDPSSPTMEEQDENDALHEQEEEEDENVESEKENEDEEQEAKGVDGNLARKRPKMPKTIAPKTKHHRTPSPKKEEEVGEDEEEEEEGEDEAKAHWGHDFWEIYNRNAKLASQMWQTPFNFTCFVLFLVVVLLVAVSAMFLIPLAFSISKLTPEQHLSTFRKDLHRVLDQKPLSGTDQRKKFSIERTLYYFAEQMLRRRAKTEQFWDANMSAEGQIAQGAPLVLLIAGGDESAVQRQFVAERYPQLLKKHWPTYRIVNVTVQPTTTKTDLEQQALTPLFHADVPSDFVLILNAIDRLSGDAPLFLHSLADPENSPLVDTRHNVLLILTMTKVRDAEKSSEAEASDCETQITNSLLTAWRSNQVTDDQIYPIVARINAIPICLI